MLFAFHAVYCGSELRDFLSRASVVVDRVVQGHQAFKSTRNSTGLGCQETRSRNSTGIQRPGQILADCNAECRPASGQPEPADKHGDRRPNKLTARAVGYRALRYKSGVSYAVLQVRMGV